MKFKLKSLQRIYIHPSGIYILNVVKSLASSFESQFRMMSQDKGSSQRDFWILDDGMTDAAYSVGLKSSAEVKLVD
jgi:hypothetical protein